MLKKVFFLFSTTFCICEWDWVRIWKDWDIENCFRVDSTNKVVHFVRRTSFSNEYSKVRMETSSKPEIILVQGGNWQVIRICTHIRNTYLNTHIRNFVYVFVNYCFWKFVFFGKYVFCTYFDKDIRICAYFLYVLWSHAPYLYTCFFFILKTFPHW